MADNEVNIHVKTPGAAQAKQQLDGIGKSTKEVGDTASRSGRKGAEGMDKLGQAGASAQSKLGKLKSSMVGWLTTLGSIAVAVRLVTSALNAQKQAMTEHAEVVSQQQNKLLRLQYLGGMFKERPELRKQVAAYAEYGRRPFEEVADAWYNLRSKSGSLSSGMRESILKEALELGRTDPNAPLDSLVDMFTLYAKKTGQTDANRIQNVLTQTIKEAGGSTTDVSKHMPRFLPIGMTGGLTGAQAAGLWSYATTQTADAAVATTGLQAVFMGLQGKGTPESQKLLASLGISQDMGFFAKMRILSGQYGAGKFSLGHAEQLAGREGAAILLSILQNPQAMMQAIGSVSGSDRGDIDITGGMIAGLMGQDKVAYLEEERRRTQIQIQNQKGRNTKALQWQLYLTKYEKAMRDAGTPEFLISEQLWAEEVKMGIGLDPGDLRGVGTPILGEATMNDVIRQSEGPPRPASPTIINNNYSHDQYYFPSAGTPLDRDIGPRAPFDVVP